MFFSFWLQSGEICKGRVVVCNLWCCFHFHWSRRRRRQRSTAIGTTTPCEEKKFVTHLLLRNHRRHLLPLVHCRSCKFFVNLYHLTHHTSQPWTNPARIGGFYVVLKATLTTAAIHPWHGISLIFHDTARSHIADWNAHARTDRRADGPWSCRTEQFNWSFVEIFIAALAHYNPATARASSAMRGKVLSLQHKTHVASRGFDCTTGPSVVFGSRSHTRFHRKQVKQMKKKIHYSRIHTI